MSPVRHAASTRFTAWKAAALCLALALPGVSRAQPATSAAVLDRNWRGMTLPLFHPAVTPSAIFEYGSLLIVSGDFGAVGDIVAPHVVAWNGERYVAMGALPGRASRFTLYQGQPVAVVRAGTPDDGLWRWDGSEWRLLASVFGDITSVGEYAGELFIAGVLDAIDGVPVYSNLLHFDGQRWETYGGDLTGSTFFFSGALAVGDKLYAALAGPVASQTLRGVIQWDGVEWTSVGLGTTFGPLLNNVAFLASDGTTLYASGGTLSISPRPIQGVARWDGAQWSQAGASNVPVNARLTMLGPDLVALAPSGPDALRRLAGDQWIGYGDGMGRVTQATMYGASLVVTKFAAAGIANTAPVLIRTPLGWDELGITGGSEGIPGNSVDGRAWSGQLVVASNSGVLGGPSLRADRIAVWDGSTWDTPLGSPGGDVVRLTTIGERLFALGNLSGGLGVKEWGGVNWSNLGAGVYASATALTEYAGELYAGGDFDSGPGYLMGFLPRVARWDGTAWNRVVDGISADLGPAYVRAAQVVAGKLYFGGHFNRAGGVFCANIVSWDGSTFGALGGGVDLDVQALATYANELIVAGDFSRADTVAALGVARWDGSAWHAMGTRALRVSGFTTLDGVLYAVGDFVDATGDSANTVARWEDGEWRVMGTGAPFRSRALTWIEGYRGDLYAGGSVSAAFGVATHGIVRLPNANAAGVEPSGTTANEPLLVTPNPGEVSDVRFTLSAPATARLRIYDLSGRLVATPLEAALGAGAHVVRWADRARPGVYLARLEVPGQPARVVRIARLR